MLHSPWIDWLIEVLVIPSTQHIKQEDVAFGSLVTHRMFEREKCEFMSSLVLLFKCHHKFSKLLEAFSGSKREKYLKERREEKGFISKQKHDLLPLQKRQGDSEWALWMPMVY